MKRRLYFLFPDESHLRNAITELQALNLPDNSLHIASDTNIKDIEYALSHHEILLMIDISSEQVRSVENLIHRNHPEAVLGGITWHSDLFNT